jgi:hypothetical protein
MSDAAFIALFACLLTANIACWCISPTKGTASINAYAAGINSLGLLQSILKVLV